MTPTPQAGAKIIFEAEDRTAAGVAAANAGIDKVEKSGKKATKSLEGAGKSGEQAGGAIARAFDRAASKVEGVSQGSTAVSKSMTKLGGALKSAFVPATAAIAAFTAALAFGDKVASESLVAQRATARLQVSIDGAREAFGGYVSDLKLAQMANKGFALGVVSNGKDLEKLSRGVAAIAEDLGGDATELLDSAIVGIGRKSTAVLDNLGIILTQSQAEEEYAATLGKTVEQLTAYERAQSFTKVAIDRVADAARKGTKANDSYAESWKKTKVSLENVQNSLYGFDAIGGRIRETVRELDSELLELMTSGDLLGRNQTENVARINAALEKQGLSYQEVKNYLIDVNNLETLRGGEVRSEKQLRVALNELAAEGLRHQEKQIKLAEKFDREAAAEARAAAEAEAVGEMQHELDLLRAMGGTEEGIRQAEKDVLLLRLQQAEAAERVDDALVKQLEREIEILDTQQLFAKKNKPKGGGRGPTRAEREQAAGERLLQQMGEEIRRVELLADLSRNAEESKARIAAEARNLRLAELELEERVLGVTRARNSVERTRNENRLAAIQTERELLDLEARVEAEREINRLIAEALELSTLRAQNEASTAKRASERAQVDLDEQRAAIEHRATIESQAARTAIQRLDIQRAKEAELARLARSRLEDERKATEAQLDAREATLRSEVGGDPLEQERRQEEFRQLAHEREVARLQYEQQIRRNLEAEKVAMMQAERERFAAQMQVLHDSLGNFEQFRAEVTEFVGFFQGRANEEADAELRSTVNMLEQKAAAQREGYQRELEAAKGNAGLQNRIKRQQEKTDRALRKQIELAEAKHQDKRKRQEMRSAGWQLAIVAVVEGIKAVAAAASFNYVEALLHGAASTAASIKAALLLSGRIPGGGAVAAVGAGSGGANNMSAGASDQEYVDPSNVPGSVPGQAARRESATPRETPQTAGGPVFQGPVTINAWGSIDDDVTTKLARQLKKAPYMTED